MRRVLRPPTRNDEASLRTGSSGMCLETLIFPDDTKATITSWSCQHGCSPSRSGRWRSRVWPRTMIWSWAVGRLHGRRLGPAIDVQGGHVFRYDNNSSILEAWGWCADQRALDAFVA